MRMMQQEMVLDVNAEHLTRVYHAHPLQTRQTRKFCRYSTGNVSLEAL